MTAPTRSITLPAPVVAILESWMHDSRVGYIQLNFAPGGIANVTVHTTIPVTGDRPTHVSL